MAFLAMAAVGLTLVATGTAFLSGRIARASALADAERTASRLSEFLVAPILADALAGVPGRAEELRKRVADRLQDRSLEAVFVWTGQGEVLYSSDPTLVGMSGPPDPELRKALDGDVVSDLAEGSELRFAGEAGGPLLEVYVPLTVNGTRLVFETYFDSSRVDRDAARLRGQIIPLAVGALCILQLVQIPVAVSLARRGRRQDRQQTELMTLSLEASERERRAIATDVHRGPVPQLAGITADLTALRETLPPERRPLVDKLTTAVASAGRSLRRLVVDLYPPGPGGPDLVAALEDLVVPLEEAGVRATVTAAPLPKLDMATAAAVYRTAKEALTNVGRHAGARHVWVTLEPAGPRTEPAVRLQVADDGVGFPADALERREQGHLGLRLVADRIEDAGGVLELAERPGGGASVTAVFPAVPGT